MLFAYYCYYYCKSHRHCRPQWRVCNGPLNKLVRHVFKCDILILTAVHTVRDVQGVARRLYRATYRPRRPSSRPFSCRHSDVSLRFVERGSVSRPFDAYGGKKIKNPAWTAGRVTGWGETRRRHTLYTVVVCSVVFAYHFVPNRFELAIILS